MRKDDLVFTGHMLDTAERLVAKLSGKSRADYDGDENLRLALAHLLQIVGEAAGRVCHSFAPIILRYHGAQSSERGTRWCMTT